MNASNNDYWVGTQLANDEGLLPISPTRWDFLATPDASLNRLILPDEARNFHEKVWRK